MQIDSALLANTLSKALQIRRIGQHVRPQNDLSWILGADGGRLPIFKPKRCKIIFTL